MTAKEATSMIPPERQISSRHNLEEVHEIMRLLIRVLASLIQRTQMVIRPRHALLLAPSLDNIIRHLRSEAQMMNLMTEGMRFSALEEVLQVMHVHIPITHTLSRREVEITNDLIDSHTARDQAALPPLFVEML